MANYTSVVASNICDAAGNKLASGTVSFQATDAGNQPLNFQVGGGGQVVTTPATAAITAGVIAGGFQVADSANTSPTGILYRITIMDTTLNRVVATYSLVTVTGATFNLDNYSQSGAAVLPPIGGSVFGSLTVTGNLNVTGSFTPGVLGNVTASQVVANNLPTCINVKTQFGALGDGVTDDTAAIQAALNFAGISGSGTQHMCLFFPAGNYKIANTLVYEGNNGLGVKLLGESGRVNDNPSGSKIIWYGPNMGTMLLMLSSNNSVIDSLDFDCNSGAQVGVWWDASNTVTPATYIISAISRSGNVVTATTSAAHAVTPGRIVKIAGSTGGATSFNGTFHVLYANDNTHISWIQTGSTEVGNAAGTVTNYRSATSNGGIMRSVTVIRPKAVSSTITSITGTNPITVTTSTPHFLTLDDMAIVRSTSDSTYNAVWRVVTIPTSTTATMQLVTATLANNPDGLGSSGGTVLAGGLGVRISHKDSLTPQVSAMSFYDVQVIGDGLGNSVAAFKVDGGGNAKDFNFYNLFVSATRYGLVDFLSGATAVYGYQSSLQTPDSSPLFASIEFLNMGENVTISGLETEATGGNNRLLASTAQGSQIHFDASEWASAAPTDDVVIAFWGALTLTSSKLMNLRTASSVPWMIPSVLSFNGTSSASLVSISSSYSNTAAGGASPSAGWIPVKDVNGNIFMAAGSYYNNRAVNVTSISDNSVDPSTGLLTPLNGFMPTQVIASTSTGGNVGIAASGFVRMASTDAVNFRNNSNAADVNGISKNTSDQVIVGGSAGVVLASGTALARYARYSLVLSPASVAANTTAEQSFASAVTSGDIIIGISKPTAQVGLGIVGHRSSGTTLFITFSNNTGAPITPTASETYQVVAVQ